MEKVVLHPLVLRNVTDHYNRVALDTGKRVVGVLTGTSFKGTIDVTSSYADLPFEEDEGDPRICNYFESMLSMFRILNVKDHVVGWYSTGPNLQDNDLCVHALFNDYVPTPVLVMIDVQPKELGLPTKAYYVAEENTTQKRQKVFVHVPSEIAVDEVEEIGVEHLPRDVNDTTISTFATEMIGKLAALKGLDAQLEEIRSYFELVIEGKLPINYKILYHVQDVFSLLQNLNVTKAVKAFAVKVMHSPPRHLTAKNHTADGCGLWEVQINDNFVKLSEALYVAEQKAIGAVVEVRSKVQREMMMMTEKDKKFMELYILAQKERSERDRVESVRDGPKETREEKELRLLREKIREELKRDMEREIRVEAEYASIDKNNKNSRDRDRDMSEKVAPEMANTGARGGEVMYDQRLFNPEKGMDSGFATDDAYNINDKGLFAALSPLTTMYKPGEDCDDEMRGGADEKLDKIDAVFIGASGSSGPRDGPDGFDNVQPEDLLRPRTNLDEGRDW